MVPDDLESLNGADTITDYAAVVQMLGDECRHLAWSRDEMNRQRHTLIAELNESHRIYSHLLAQHRHHIAQLELENQRLRDAACQRAAELASLVAENAEIARQRNCRAEVRV